MQRDVTGGSQVSSRSPTPQFARRANYQDYSPAAPTEGLGSPEPDYVPQQEIDMEYEQLQDEASDEDELEEDEIEEEEEEGTTTAATRSRVGEAIPGLFDEDAVLPEEEFGEMTIKELYTLMKAGVINLNPAYQREPVWNDDTALGLIESIFRNAHIPELLFRIYAVEQANGDDPQLPEPSKLSNPDRYRSSGKVKEADRDVKPTRLVWNCADGKQRCTSIRRFMDGDIPLRVKRKSDAKSRMVPFHDLSPKERAIFESKKVRFGFYRELSYSQECEIFKRVQLGVGLTQAEKITSTSQYRLWINELIRHYSPTQIETQLANPTAFAPRVINSRKRNSSLGVFLGLVSSLVNGHARASYAAKTTLKQFDKKEPALPSPESQKMVLRILERLKRLTLVPQLPQDAEKYKWPHATQVQGRPETRMAFAHRVWQLPNEDKSGKSITRRLSPVEIMFIPLVIQKFESRRDGDLLEIIEQLRRYIETAHKNQIKDNSDVWNNLRDFMNNYDPDSQLKYLYNDDGSLVENGRRQPPIEHAPQVLPSLRFPPAPSASSSTSNKGKRSLDETSSSSSQKKHKTLAAEDAERKRQEAELEEKKKREEQAAEEQRRKEEEERLQREAEAKRVREEERKKREEDRKRRVAEAQARSLERQRKLEENSRREEEKSRREKEELEAADRARKEKIELERSEIRRKEQEEIERIMGQDLDQEPVPEAVPSRANSPSGPTRQSKEQPAFEPTIFGFPPTDSTSRPEHSLSQHGSNTSQVSSPSVSRQSSPPAATPSSSATARNGSQPSKPNSNSRSLPRHDFGEKFAPSSPPRSISKPSSSSTPPSSKAKQKSKPNNPITSSNSTSHSSSSSSTRSYTTVASSEPSPPARVYSGAKARIAGSILAVAAPAPAPSRRAVPALSEQPPRQPERRFINTKPQAQLQFDSRGRVIRPELAQREEVDELEAYGGRGEDDIVLYRSQNDHLDEDNDNDRRKDQEVRALLAPTKPKTSVVVDPRDREVQERLFSRLSGTGSQHGRNTGSSSSRSTSAVPSRPP
ncbi:hypothetical protein JCM3765_001267, partial [Sporobolomyces pararoseus]